MSTGRARFTSKNTRWRTGFLPMFRVTWGRKAGFFLWLPVPDGEAAALQLWRETGIRVLPGAYLARDVDSQNPGKGFVRVAMVTPIDEIQAALIRLRDCLYR